MAINYQNIPSPCFVLEVRLLRRNLELLDKVQKAAGISIILAFKSFAMWPVFPLVRQYLKGATASSLFEAKLCVEEMRSMAHSYSPAYLPVEFEELLQLSSHITFNSLTQYEKYRSQTEASARPVSCGLRVNPGYSDVKTDLYNPASPTSRLGIEASLLKEGIPKGIEGLHFHTLCESDSYALEQTLAAFEQRFGHLLSRVKWINMGGGHLITRKGYDTAHLIELLRKFREKYDVDIILEPGSAVVWETGVLVSTVLDIVESGGLKTAILDVSFTAHMPDTLEMPYRPSILGASDPIAGKPTFRIGGVSCLAGDFMEAYSFEKELHIGDMVVLRDMMHYTMVKTTMFNGVRHPSIAIWKENDEFQMVREFGYEDFKNRLG